MPSGRKCKRVLAIASGGGHWVQLLRLRPGFAGCDVLFATTRRSFQTDLDAGARFTVIPDCNRNEPLRLGRAFVKIGWILLRERPDVVISTGAAPGFIAIWIAHKLRIRTIWVDSVANAEELSLSGQRAGACASLWLTQWQHLAREGGPYFRGSVL
ncbi:MAG: UDP-N-acetylglucosamine--LPS N-acetylglucosamine transferase [Opitutaceae bacterium]|nr:UDP-N-acetylglucosamine--LPS N-acetylglucosamine transferase [Opitutaceae bacterium]